ncbi:MAG: HAMP domain-containing protein [Acidimicrobiales bacterium]
MRRELIAVFIAMAVMITAAFVIPLGLAARAGARDRGFDQARADAATLGPLLAAGDLDALRREVEQRNELGPLEVTVVRGTEALGAPLELTPRLESALRDRRSAEGDTAGGGEVVRAVVSGDGTVGAVRVFSPGAELHRGVLRSLAMLSLVGAVLVAVAVAVADRLAARLRAPVLDLASAAARVGAGETAIEVPVGGPRELAATATAFNSMSAQVTAMMERERAMVGELAHRLRTPLTRLRLDLDRVADPEVAAALAADVAALSGELDQLIRRARPRSEPDAATELVTVAGDRFEFWAALAADEDRACTFDALVDTAVIPADPEEVAAAVDVLLENVFAHTEPATAFRMWVDGGAWGAELVVEDAGPGFDPAMAAAGVSGAGSTGLGLSIVQRLVDEVGGSLTVDRSTLGGARIRVLFEPELRGVVLSAP